MDEVIRSAVERVIRSVQDNLGEHITIDDMARTAMFSKFHFTRMFQRVTGISPGRFLSALRLQEAKRLLLATSTTVADISHVVGYNSIGTFSSRFRSSVGVSPTEYRRHRGIVPLPAPVEPSDGAHGAAIRGSLRPAPDCRPGRVVISLFPDRIAQGVPVRHLVLSGAGPYELTGVPAGTWHLLAHSMTTGVSDPVDGVPRIAAIGPIEVGTTDLTDADLSLHPRRIFDPPTLLAHLDTERGAPIGVCAEADVADVPGTALRAA